MCNILALCICIYIFVLFIGFLYLYYVFIFYYLYFIFVYIFNKVVFKVICIYDFYTVLQSRSTNSLKRIDSATTAALNDPQM